MLKLNSTLSCSELDIPMENSPNRLLLAADKTPRTKFAVETGDEAIRVHEASSKGTPKQLLMSRMSAARVTDTRKPGGEPADVEALGGESAESMENNKLKVVRLKHLVVGKDYEYQDRVGDWFPVKIIEGPVSGAYVGQPIFQKKVRIENIKPGNCIESAAPHQTNWVSYFFWVCFDLGFTGGIISIFILEGWWAKLEPYKDWLVHCVYGIIPILLIARLFWWFIFRNRDRAVKSVQKFVSRKVEIDGKEVYLVGSMHVSPGSVSDVQKVVDEVDPDVIMIELDYDRLASMKENSNPRPVDQWLFNKEDGTVVRGVQTDWNALLNRRPVDGPLTFNADNVRNKILLAPFPKGNLSNFVYGAQKNGAKAVLFVDEKLAPVAQENESPIDDSPASARSSGYYDGATPSRLFIGSESCSNLWGHFFRFGRSKAPEIPCFLVPAIFDQADEGAIVSFKVRSSNLDAPVTCKKHCCTVTCTTLTGIGVMYGLIRLAGVEAGGEFVLADKLAEERGKVLATIDMGIGRLGAALCARVIPYPANLWYALVAWASVPRHLLTWFLFPQKHKVDLLLNMLWGFARFKLRTWLAFLCGVVAAGAIISGLVFLVQYLAGLGTSAVAKAGGATQKDAENIGQTVALCIGVGIQLWLYPVVYKGLLDSRDEQMYRGAVAQIRRRPNATKFVIVVGAAHTNGMMRRMYERGFMPNSNFREERRRWAPFPFNKGFLFEHLYYGWPASKDRVG